MKNDIKSKFLTGKFSLNDNEVNFLFKFRILQKICYKLVRVDF